jgi:hypothetical protein
MNADPTQVERKIEQEILDNIPPSSLGLKPPFAIINPCLY